MKRDDERTATLAETMAFLRQHGWLRDDGDEERLHTTRPIDARSDDERCDMFYQRVCRYRRGHPGPHRSQ